MIEQICDPERQTFICKCESLEHQVSFWQDEYDGTLYCEPHLTTYNNFFKRLWIGLKYAFGYKCKYGNWDSMLFKEEDLEKLRKYLNDNHLKKNQVKK